MQQKQKKNEEKHKKGSSIAKMMAKRDLSRLQEHKESSYMECLQAPRGKKYMRLLNRITEIGDQLSEIEEEIDRLEEELPEPPKPEVKVSQPEFPEPEPSGPEQLQPEVKQEEPVRKEVTWLKREPQKTVNVTWTRNMKSDTQRALEFKEKQQRLKELNDQRNSLVEELKETQRQFEASLPAPQKALGIIYPDWSREILLKYGVIACPGSKFRSAEELIAQVKPRTEEEERQWLKGNDAYSEYCSEEMLLVEIYIDAICVVYRDGSVKVV